jgi:hypothetical protein
MTKTQDMTRDPDRSLQRQASAGAHHLVALCQKRIYEREVELSQLDTQIVSCSGDQDTQISPNTPQVPLPVKLLSFAI